MEENPTSGAITCAVCHCNMVVAARRRKHLIDLCPTCLLLPEGPISQEMLRKIFNYDPNTGELTYARNFARRKAGAIATYEAGQGYKNVYLSGNKRAHRIIWLMQTGEDAEAIDHINHDRSDNRWSNLRAATAQENAMNSSARRNNRSGYTGVRKVSGRGNFRAEIMVGGKTKHLGVFSTAAQAAEAYKKASSELGFHENHGELPPA